MSLSYQKQKKARHRSSLDDPRQRSLPSHRPLKLLLAIHKLKPRCLGHLRSTEVSQELLHSRKPNDMLVQEPVHAGAPGGHVGHVAGLLADADCSIVAGVLVGFEGVGNLCASGTSGGACDAVEVVREGYNVDYAVVAAASCILVSACRFVSVRRRLTSRRSEFVSSVTDEDNL